METAGIIAEYNPFHNGHLYQLQQVRARTGADFIIVAMSGDFVQRGEPAIYDKYTRTRMALNAGADLVLELPVSFATGSAEDFASCAVALLDRIGAVDLLCFGSECGDIRPLRKLAGILSEEPQEYTVLLKEFLRQGDSFPKARASALAQYLSRQSLNSGDETSMLQLLSSPNNILGMEYLKALIRRRSSIEPFTILRQGGGYHDTEIQDDGCFASASAIRKALAKGDISSAAAQMPACSQETIETVLPLPVFADDLTGLFHYRLLDLSHTDQDLTIFSDVSRELADRIRRQLLDYASFSDHVAALKTRQYTYTRISRALLHILLGITDQELTEYRRNQYVSYARILGFRRTAGPLLSRIKEASEIPLIAKTADARRILNEDALRMFRTDLHASHIYQSIRFQKSGIRSRNEFTQSVIIL